MSEHKLTARASKASSGHSHSADDSPIGHSSVEPIRFSVRNGFESESSSTGRIIIFVIVVIVLGVGLTFLIQNFVANRSGATAESSSSSTSAAIHSDYLDIEDKALSDLTATKLTSNDLYTNSALSLGSVNNVATGTKVNKLTYQPYNSFTNITWEMSAGGTGLPATNISYNADTNSIEVKFTKLDVANEELLGPINPVAGDVTKISANSQNSEVTYTLQLSESSKYYAYVLGGNTLALDIKSETNLTQPISSSSSSVSSTESASSSSASSSSSSAASSSSSVASGTTNYDNTLSQSKQSVISTVSGNTIYNDTYYYIDYGDSFQFSWAMRNTGEASIPNATAELVEDNGVNYVKVTINNLAQDILAAQSKTKATITISTAGSNIVDVTRESTTNGTSIYMVQLKHKGNFRLHSTLTYNNYQLLSLQLAD